MGRAKKKRNRLTYLSLIFIVMLLGLGSRKFGDFLPEFVSNYLGDTLWALMVFFIMGFLFKRSSTLKVGIYSLVFSFLIEISQLYHAPWLDSIRHNKIGGLILGFGFLWSDLICYTVGVIIGILLEILFLYKIKKHKRAYSK